MSSMLSNSIRSGAAGTGGKAYFCVASLIACSYEGKSASEISPSVSIPRRRRASSIVGFSRCHRSISFFRVCRSSPSLQISGYTSGGLVEPCLASNRSPQTRTLPGGAFGYNG